MATDLTDLSLSLGVSLSAASQKALDLSTPTDQVALSQTLAYAFGTGAEKANQIWHDRRALAGGASEELDLAGTLENAYGAAATFAKVRGIVVLNRSGEALGAHPVTDAEIAVGGAAANEFLGPFQAAGDALGIPAGGVLVIATPDADAWAVTADTADLLKIENLDGADEALYDIVIWGEAA